MLSCGIEPPASVLDDTSIKMGSLLGTEKWTRLMEGQLVVRACIRRSPSPSDLPSIAQ
jgi:hypothetical protein